MLSNGNQKHQLKSPFLNLFCENSFMDRTTNCSFTWNCFIEILNVEVHVFPHQHGIETFSLMRLPSAGTFPAIICRVQHQTGICLVSHVKSIGPKYFHPHAHQTLLVRDEVARPNLIFGSERDLRLTVLQSFHHLVSDLWDAS